MFKNGVVPYSTAGAYFYGEYHETTRHQYHCCRCRRQIPDMTVSIADTNMSACDATLARGRFNVFAGNGAA